MKRSLEIIIVLVMFYGVWSLFARVADIFWKNPSTTVVVFVALITSIIIVYLYSLMIGNDATARLQTRVNELADLLSKKEQELDNAFKVKKDVIRESDLYLKNTTE